MSIVNLVCSYIGDGYLGSKGLDSSESRLSRFIYHRVHPERDPCNPSLVTNEPHSLDESSYRTDRRKNGMDAREEKEQEEQRK